MGASTKNIGRVPACNPARAVRSRAARVLPNLPSCPERSPEWIPHGGPLPETAYRCMLPPRTDGIPTTNVQHETHTCSHTHYSQQTSRVARHACSSKIESERCWGRTSIVSAKSSCTVVLHVCRSSSTARSTTLISIYNGAYQHQTSQNVRRSINTRS